MAEHPPLAGQGARAIKNAFSLFQLEFKGIALRARGRFEHQDWRGLQNDAVERLDLYAQVIRVIVAEMRTILRQDVTDKALWAEMKKDYSRLIAGQLDFELAETFFNSVTRRIFDTVGVDPSIEFVDSDFDFPPADPRRSIYRTYPPSAKPSSLVSAVLADYSFHVTFSDLRRDAALAGKQIEAALAARWGGVEYDAADFLRPVFYRGQGAYILGRIRRGADLLPVVLALCHDETGIIVDAVLLTEDDVSILFSFTRSYFHVDVSCPHDLVMFLKTLIPLKRLAELYISIGYNKHGKTELYRGLLRHLEFSDDHFEAARGQKGMVMIVFTLPSYDLVFKVIRDRFAEPKTTTRQEVMERYQLVFNHDRAGRLVDAQEFEHLRFERRRFSASLLQELTAAAPSLVTADDQGVDIKHLYIERRLTPLDLYVREADPQAARLAAIDYGYALKDLASTNIFPGDILLKNFGVTRHGRVVFYDYDELSLLTSLNFRSFPRPQTFSDEYASDPWFYVGKNDVFPEEFRTFLGLQGELRQAFEQVHSDLFGVEYWKTIQKCHLNGEIFNLLSYRQEQRLHASTLA